jgi:hypothetical protein
MARKRSWIDYYRAHWQNFNCYFFSADPTQLESAQSLERLAVIIGAENLQPADSNFLFLSFQNHVGINDKVHIFERVVGKF